MDKYSFNIFWSEEDNAYFAICPEFPGLSAFGDTPEQALAEGKIVLEMTIETYKEAGLPLPEPKVYAGYSGQFRVRIPKTLHAQLVSQAAAEGVSLNALVENYLAEGVGTKRGVSVLQNALDHALQTIQALTLTKTSAIQESSRTSSAQTTGPNVPARDPESPTRHLRIAP
jgi:predicted RNase H-like HicB family nuclease